ncbi:MAG: OmpA family protein [Desulfobacterales bacterium]|nr:OmpA family protein [Desulfobacterales bacterium]
MKQSKRIILSSLVALALVFFAGSGWTQEALQVSVLPKGADLEFRTLDANRLLVSVLDAQGYAILGLTKNDFQIKEGPKNGVILSVAPLVDSEDLGLNIVLVVDNSSSMKHRKAVGPLLAAVKEFLATVRPIDNVSLILFSDSKGEDKKWPTTRVLHSSDTEALNRFLQAGMTKGITDGTYLYDAMMKGVSIIADLPKEDQKFMVVFSDGEDLNSSYKKKEVALAAEKLTNFSAYSIDYMDKPVLDDFLRSFSEKNHGVIRKAKQSTDFMLAFNDYSKRIFHRYIVAYRFHQPPFGTLAITPATLTIEEVMTIDSSPLLNHIYFPAGSSNMLARYTLFANPGEAGTFVETDLKTTIEKYHHVLNVIGKRLTDNPDANITLVGCNSGVGNEKIALSQKRADRVKRYFITIWGIDPARIATQSRGLPDAASTNTDPRGQVENQRVEILSDHPVILDTIKSTYFDAISDSDEIFITPSIQAEAGIEKWSISLLGDDMVLKKIDGQGAIPAKIAFDTASFGMATLAQFKSLRAVMAVEDNEQNSSMLESATPVTVVFHKSQERLSRKQGYKVIERYALILFEFNKSDITGRNQIIVDHIVKRIQELPDALVKVIGHTDIIGKEDYNMKLSVRRADAIFNKMAAADPSVPKKTTVTGAGPHSPPYDNHIPEGRAFNRTVIVTIQYEKSKY